MKCKGYQKLKTCCSATGECMAKLIMSNGRILLEINEKMQIQAIISGIFYDYGRKSGSHYLDL